MKQAFNTLVLTAILSLLAAPGAVLAQDDETSPPSLADVWLVVPKADHAEQFEQAMKDHMAYRKEIGDPRDWQAFTVVIGADLTPYAFRYCCFDWADHDAYIEWSNGTEVGKHFNENVNPHVASYQHFFDYIDWDNSHWPEDSGPFKYFGVTTWELKMGEAPVRSQALSKLTGTAKENGWEGTWIFLSTIGGDAELSIVVPFENYADMAEPSPTFYEFIVEHLGEEEANATFKSFSSSFWDADYSVWMHRPELSMEESGEE